MLKNIKSYESHKSEGNVKIKFSDHIILINSYTPRMATYKDVFAYLKSVYIFVFFFLISIINLYHGYIMHNTKSSILPQNYEKYFTCAYFILMNI